jgi:hypothetical protein
MANQEHVAILKMGIDVWNRWVFQRSLDPDFTPDLSRADLSGLDLSRADLRSANLRRANLSRANLTKALLGAGMIVRRSAKQTRESFIEGEEGKFVFGAGFTLQTSLSGGADLTEANLHDADLSRADLYDANLTGADLTGAILTDATFSNNTIWPDSYDPIEHGAIPFSENFKITFHEDLSPEQISTTLAALADFYRKIGGVGFRVDFELDDVLVREPVYA